MKGSYITEILALLLAGVSGGMFFIGGWVSCILGFIILFLDSYFIISRLKVQTVKEYLEKIDIKDNKEDKK